MNKQSRDNSLEPIADKLRELRGKKRMVQKDVATYLGVSQQTYSKYEAASIPIDSNVILKLCKLYEVSSDELLCVPAKETEQQKGIVNLSYQMSESEMDTLAKKIANIMTNKNL